MMSQKRGLLFGISEFDFGHEVSSSLMMASLSGLHSAFFKNMHLRFNYISNVWLSFKSRLLQGGGSFFKTLNWIGLAKY